MDFKAILASEVNEGVLDLSSFVRAVQQYNSLDLALADLPSEYLEFYSHNEKKLKKPLTRLNLLESAEDPGYLGYSPTNNTVRKKIKYKGEIIVIEWDSEYSVWVPLVAKRSIVQALKYGKELIDKIV